MHVIVLLQLRLFVFRLFQHRSPCFCPDHVAAGTLQGYICWREDCFRLDKGKSISIAFPVLFFFFPNLFEKSAKVWISFRPHCDAPFSEWAQNYKFRLKYMIFYFYFFSTLQLCVLTHCLWFLAHKWWLQIKVSTLKEKDLLLVGFQSFKTASIVCVCFFVSSVFMEQYPTEEDMIEWAKRESEREEKERLARLTQQEQEDLELAIALSKSELSWGGPVPLYWSGSARHSLARPRKHQSKVGIVQDWFSITCWPHEETQNSSLTRSTPRLSILRWSPWFW